MNLIRKFKSNGGQKIKIKEFQVTEEAEVTEELKRVLKSRTDLNHGGFTPESDADVVFQGFRRLKCRNPFRKEGKSWRNDSIIAFSGNIEKSTKFRFSLKQR